MKLEIDYKLVCSCILCVLLNKFDIYLIFLISIIIHECIHLLFGKIINGKVNYLKLGIFGMSMNMAFIGKQNLIKKILFFLSGPIRNYIIAYNFKDTNITITYVNYALFFFNLLPILPLDGGNIILEILKRIIGKGKAYYFLLKFTKCMLFIITFGYAIVLIKIKNVFILGVLIYLWYLYYIEETRYTLFKKTIKCMKNIEKN